MSAIAHRATNSATLDRTTRLSDRSSRFAQPPRFASTSRKPVPLLCSCPRFSILADSLCYPVSKGARALIPESHFPEAKEGTTYVAPQVLVDVDPSMKVMSEETFGPVVGIMKVCLARFLCLR